jgi:hypothetical protein
MLLYVTTVLTFIFKMNRGLDYIQNMVEDLQQEVFNLFVIFNKYFNTPIFLEHFHQLQVVNFN